jgi:acetyl-CoA C-acetyltransferase
MKPVYIVDYLRSAFSRAHPTKTGVDAFESIRADQLFAHLVDNLLSRPNYKNTNVDELVIGCALPVKEQWNFGGRYPIFMSELPNNCASRSIEQQCGSGLAALRSGAMSIASGCADTVFAGGYEHMTRVPMGPTLFEENILTVPEVNPDTYDMRIVMNMGLTAEKLAKLAGITRRAMDEFALASHRKAAQADMDGFFNNERVSIQINEHQNCNQDTCIRPNTDLASLSELRSIFKEDGVISAGNSSPLTTGAALVSLMSENKINELSLTPMAKILSCVDVGVNPEIMGSGIVPAVEKLLHINALSVQDIDVWELNEAFSVVPLYAMQQLDIPMEKVNLCGGALALGHPLGATGVRLAGTLARILQQQKGRYGVASACIGGGQGIAMLIERV